MDLYDVIDTRTHVHFIMELCKGKNLYHFIKRYKGIYRIPEPLVALIFEQIVSAVAFMHANDVVHRDLKLENILIDNSDARHRIKIIDFGFARDCRRDQKVVFECGTPQYMCPDMTRRHSYFGQAADVWSLGVILFLLLTGGFPFLGQFEEDLYRKIQRGKYKYPEDDKDSPFEDNSKTSELARALVKKILELDASKRISIGQILEDPWLLQFYQDNNKIKP